MIQLAKAALALVPLCLAVMPGVARADTKDQCVAANTNAQRQRSAGHFRAARELLLRCSRPECPKLVRDDCISRFASLDLVAPTVVFAAKDAAGDDVIDVNVAIDGEAAVVPLSAAALPVDPGVHTFRFTTKGATPVDKKLVVRDGEKGRQERVVFPDLNAPSRAVGLAPVAVAAPSVVGEDNPQSTWNGQKTAAAVVSALGVAGVAVGAVFGGLSFSSWSSSQSECSTSSCTNRSQAVNDHDSALTDATLADVGLIAGGALVVTGLVLYVTAPRGAAKTGLLDEHGLVFGASPAPHGGTFGLGGRF